MRGVRKRRSGLGLVPECGISEVVFEAPVYAVFACLSLYIRTHTHTHIQNHSCPSHYTAISDLLSQPEAWAGGRGVNSALSPLVNNTNAHSQACTATTHQS